jgi:fibrillarin-like rRNA methylase
VYGERWATVDGMSLRAFEPTRSKLAAAIVRGWDGPLPAPGERWLYLGAASGTTASHVADLLGPDGRLYAIERSVRPFARLLGVAERWSNLLPVLGDARDPERYAGPVPIVDGIYADIAQPDQVELVLANASLLLDERRGTVLVALKTSSMGRGVPATEHLRAAERALGGAVRLVASARLDPFYRSHYLVGGQRATGGSRRPLRPRLAPEASPHGRRRRPAAG